MTKQAASLCYSFSSGSDNSSGKIIRHRATERAIHLGTASLAIGAQ
jgi:hypothetical protein